MLKSSQEIPVGFDTTQQKQQKCEIFHTANTKTTNFDRYYSPSEIFLFSINKTKSITKRKTRAERIQQPVSLTCVQDKILEPIRISIL